MCFSAPVSFISSGALLGLGGASLAMAKKEDRILAAIPFLFGIQQAAEGFQWLSINAGSTSLALGYIFLLFAVIFWPIYIPSFVYILDKKQRNVLKWFIFAGVATSLYYAVLLVSQPLSIHKVNACISYNFYFPWQHIADTAYLIAVFGPLFASSRPIFRWFGLVVAVTAAIAWIFFAYTFTSVWCFFAAIVSLMFFFYILHKRKASR